MSTNDEHTPESTGAEPSSPQGGIPLKASEPLSHNPFVHVTLDKVEAPQQPEQPVSQGIPVWAQPRFYSRAPEKASRVARTFPKREADGAEDEAPGTPVPASAQGDNSIPLQNNVRHSRPLADPRPIPKRPSGSSQPLKEDAKQADPTLRVVIEQNEPVDPDQAVIDGVEDNVEIGSDHINVPDNIYAQDDLNDLAANMPLIPQNLIFDKDGQRNAAGFAGAPPQNPMQGAFPMRPGQTARMQPMGAGAAMGFPNGGNASGMGNIPGAPQSVPVVPPAGQNSSQNLPSSLSSSAFLQGNPRNGASAANASIPLGAPGAPSVVPPGATGAISQPLGNRAIPANGGAPANPGMPRNPADPMSAAATGALAGAMTGAAAAATPAFGAQAPPGAAVNPAINPAIDPADHVSPAVAAVPASTDYRPYAASAFNAAFNAGLNPLRPHSPAMFDPSSAQMPGWRSQMDLQAAAQRGNLSSAFQDNPAMSGALGGGMGPATPSGFGAQPSAQTTPSGMPLSFDSAGSSTMASGMPSGYPSSANGIPGAPASPFGSVSRSSRADMIPPVNRSSAFPSNGDRGLPIGAGTPIPRNAMPPGPNRVAEEPSLFDQPPVPITEGMRTADSSHKKLRRVIIILIIVLLLGGGGTVGYLIYSGAIHPEDIVPTITIEVPAEDGDSSAGGDASGSSQGGSNAGSDASTAAGDAGSVVYQYTALTSDGTAYTVEETATFSEEGYCEFTTMKMKFPDAEKAKAFTDNLARDYGSSFTLDSLDGANATVTIDNSSLKLDRERYEESLRYSVEDLVILKK